MQRYPSVEYARPCAYPSVCPSKLVFCQNS